MEVGDKVFRKGNTDPRDEGIIVDKSMLAADCWLVEFTTGSGHKTRLPFHERELVVKQESFDYIKLEHQLVQQMTAQRSVSYKLGECFILTKEDRFTADVTLTIFPGGSCKTLLILPRPWINVYDFDPMFIVSVTREGMFKFLETHLEEADSRKMSYNLVSHQVLLASRFAKFEMSDFEKLIPRSEVSTMIKELIDGTHSNRS